MIINPQAADIKHEHWEGPPQPTWHTEHQLISREHMLRRIERGHLIDVFYDTEANAKNANIAQFKTFFGIKVDLAARVLGKLSTEAAFPPHIGIGFIPALIGGFSAQDMLRGLPVPLFSSMLYGFLKSCVRLDPVQMGFPYIEKRKGYEYVIPCAHGENITLYVHPSGAKFHLVTDKPDDKWRKIYAWFHPYNGEKYDDVALAKMLGRQAAPDLFLTFVKRNNALRADVLGAMRVLAQVGDQGLKGFKTKSRFHYAFDQLAPSFRLGDMWSMQDLHALRERGVYEAVLDYQGRAFDALGAHQADRDTAMTMALYYLARLTQPDKMDWLDRMADRLQLNEFIHNPNGVLGEIQDLGMIRRRDGMWHVTHAHLIGTDAGYKDWRRALFADLRYTPESWMAASDTEQRSMLSRGDGPMVQIRLNRSPPVFPKQWAEEVGVLTPDRRIRGSRINYINVRESEKQRALDNAAFNATAPVPDSRTVADSTYFAYGLLGDIEKYRVSDAAGRWTIEPSDLYHRRKGIFARLRDIHNCLNEITSPPRILFENTPEALAEYQATLARGAERLKHLQANWLSQITLPDLGITPDSRIAACMHYFMLMWEWRNIRFTPTKTAHIYNGLGQRVDWEHVLGLPSKIRKSLLPLREDQMKPEQIRFQFEGHEGLFPSIMVQRIFSFDDWFRRYPHAVDGKFLDWWRDYYMPLWEPYRDRYRAMVADAVYGPPGVSSAEHLQPTLLRELEVAQQYMEQPDKRVTVLPQERELAAGLLRHYRGRLTEVKDTAKSMLLRGYDPDRKQPVLNVPHLIVPEAAVKITVPDQLLNQGVHHDWRVWPSAAFMIVKRLPQRLAAKLKPNERRPPARLVLESSTGRQAFFADALVQDMPPWTPALQHKLDFSAAAYGMTRHKSSAFSFVTGFDLFPITEGQPVNEQVQAVTLDPQNWNALVDPKAGHLPEDFGPVTSMVVRHIGQTYIAGKPIRLRRFEAGRETGDEYTGKLKVAREISLDQLRLLSSDAAQRCGALNAQSLYSQWAEHFAHHRIPPDERKLWLLDLTAPVQPGTYRHYQPEQHPQATRPTGYDRLSAKIANDNPATLTLRLAA